ncbi:MAG: response regulator [Spirochaetaceae bacterium]|jgi:CheY-like chemotaxis protein|nr:response regulator [Spirochaetaceae bacterium]
MTETDGKKEIVLAVDDMPEVLQSINAILCQDYDVRLAVDAASALAVLKIADVDLILLDVEMPGMSGIEFLDKLQNDSAYKAIPVVFITANSEDSVIKTAIAKGAKGYVTKPFSQSALLESVQFFCS